MKIDASLRGRDPKVPAPTPFKGADGEVKGWKVAVPGGRPLATPAVSNGRVFLGGGFGSYDFYAFGAGDGRLLWHYQTEDDGPTAAVVEDEFICFNTESCELEVLTLDGRRVWKKWLGDPLMSMPAVSQGRIYMAYPDSLGDHRHYLSCFDLKTGDQFWKQPITGEIITAPVIASGHIYLATLGGELYCYETMDGQLIWQESRNATSSPAIWNNQCYFSRRHEVTLAQAGMSSVQQMESVAARGTHFHGKVKMYPGTAHFADYLDHAKRKERSPHYVASELADGLVGFAAAKGDAKMDQAMLNLGQGHVHGVWAYQGSKPFISAGRMFCAQGDCLYWMDPDSEEIRWKKKLYDSKEGEEILDSVMTPPAIVNEKLFVGTIHGDLCCLSSETGEELWREKIGEPVVFQPAVSDGRVYVPTSKGSLVVVETGDPGDDGWRMWGATGAHNGLDEEPAVVGG
jgi:outer membrane protein assembly factor BamB